jgi:hypothetical protein
MARQSPHPDHYGLRLFSLLLLGIVGCVLAVIGGLTAYNLLCGITAVFDRRTTTVTVTAPHRWHMRQQQHSLYGVSHAQIENHPEFESFAVYIVLRSGERILLGRCHKFDRDVAERIAQTIRAFLYRA